jgi:hypothetical protein
MSTTDAPQQRALFERGPDWTPTEQWSHVNGGTGLTRHGRCGLIWWQSGNYTSHCPRCCRTFTSLRGFDDHWRADDSPRGFDCADPAELRHRDGRPMFELVHHHRYGATITEYWRRTTTP